MPTKKVLVAVTALIACLAIGSATVATAKPKKKKVTTTISLTITVTPPSPYAPYSPGSGTFSGQVSAKGPSGCRKNRTVTISRGGPAVGQVGTDSNGGYLSRCRPHRPPARIRRRCRRRSSRRSAKKTVCLAATSPPVVVP